MENDDGPDWHLAAWLRHRGLKQADVVRHFGWPKGRVSKMANGVQPYHRDVVNQLAEWLELAPYELLMRPEDALALRRLRDTAYAIAAERGREFRDEASEPTSSPPAQRRRA